MKKNPQSKPKTQTRVEGVLFCPFTHNSAMKKELMKIEEFVNGQSKVGKIRIVERAGPKIRKILTNKTPWKKETETTKQFIINQTKKLKNVHALHCTIILYIVQ